MKVLIPIGSIYPSQQGGPSNSMYWLASGLVKNGYDVTIISTDDMLSDEVKRNVWINTDYGKVIFYREKWHYLPFNCIKKSIKEMNTIDIVHLNSIFYTYSWIMGLIALWKGKNIVWSIRGELDEKALIYSAWKKRIFIVFFKFIFSNKVTFHVTSLAEEAFTKRKLGIKIKLFVIPNYMVLPLKVNSSKKQYFSYLGRIHPKKAIENLIDGLALSQNFLNSDFTMRIAGDANNIYGRQLQAQVTRLGLEQKVEFVGHMEGIEKEIFLADSYFNFMPSHTENFGLVVVESLAQGTPVIACKESPWEELEQDNAGFWVENDVNSLVKVIDEILVMDEVLYKNYSKNALELSRKYDIDIGVNDWIMQYQKMLA